MDWGLHWHSAGLVGRNRFELGFTVSPTAMSWTLKAMGSVKLSARPRHEAQNGRALKAFRKCFPDTPVLIQAAPSGRHAGRDLVVG